MTDKAKLEEIKKLADAMYYAAFNLTTDASLLRKAMNEYHQFIINEYHKEEPVSEDSEEAAWFYADRKACLDKSVFTQKEVNEKRSKLEYNWEDIRIAFKAGAKWQKTKDESITEDLGEYINELSKRFPEVSFAKLSRIAVRVAKWQKAKMMAKAIEGGCFSYKNEFVHISCDIDEHITDIKMGDKVKVIVIKED